MLLLNACRFTSHPIMALPLLAYLDPGSGSILLQVLIAGLLGVLFSLRLYWRRVKLLLRRVLGGKGPDPGSLTSDHGNQP